MIMPALSLGVVSSALLLRIMRSEMIEVLVLRLHPHGLCQGRHQNTVIWQHALRNALIPF